MGSALVVGVPPTSSVHWCRCCPSWSVRKMRSSQFSLPGLMVILVSTILSFLSGMDIKRRILVESGDHHAGGVRKLCHRIDSQADVGGLRY